MATDDLVVERMSPSSGVSLLNRLKTSLNDVKEKFVTIGIKEENQTEINNKNGGPKFEGFVLSKETIAAKSSSSPPVVKLFKSKGN
ncbi:hypothetical protein JHK82_018488 [Glycine max]|nr:hypothetical protein JHK86_018513 [Glycine max]KAG5142793.1 hypothetical protein JHK82_018488 [Glycine max]